MYTLCLLLCLWSRPKTGIVNINYIWDIGWTLLFRSIFLSVQPICTIKKKNLDSLAIHRQAFHLLGQDGQGHRHKNRNNDSAYVTVFLILTFVESLENEKDYDPLHLILLSTTQPKTVSGGEDEVHETRKYNQK